MDFQDQAISFKDWKEMKDLIDKGCDYFWNNPERPWRKKIRPVSSGFGGHDWLFSGTSGSGKVSGYEPEKHGKHPPRGHGGV